MFGLSEDWSGIAAVHFLFCPPLDIVKWDGTLKEKSPAPSGIWTHDLWIISCATSATQIDYSQQFQIVFHRSWLAKRQRAPTAAWRRKTTKCPTRTVDEKTRNCRQRRRRRRRRRIRWDLKQRFCGWKKLKSVTVRKKVNVWEQVSVGVWDKYWEWVCGSEWVRVCLWEQVSLSGGWWVRWSVCLCESELAVCLWVKVNEMVCVIWRERPF